LFGIPAPEGDPVKSRAKLPLFDAPPEIMDAAGRWVARRDRGLDASESAAFSEWLQADPLHRVAFAQLDRAAAKLDRLRELTAALPGEPDADALAPARRGARSLAPVISLVMAAAAAVAILVWQPRSPLSPETQYVTEVAGYHRAVLSDGSIIELNGGTAVDVQFTAAERRARLTQGEAHFQIAQDSIKPFIVTAQSVDLRVVGTAFNVRIAPENIEVIVTEGTVEVYRKARADAAAPPVSSRLTAGQKLVVPATAAEPVPAVASATSAEIARILGWQPRIAEFSRTPLTDVVEQLNRHSAGRFPLIVIRDEELAALRIGGSFRLDQPEAFVLLLESSFGVQVERSAGRIELKKAP
jgi:transmembrane sensor